MYMYITLVAYGLMCSIHMHSDQRSC